MLSACAVVVVNSWAVAIYLTFNQVNCVNRRRVYCSPTGCWRRDRVVPLWKRAAELYAPLFLCRAPASRAFWFGPRRLEGWDDEPGIFPSVMRSNDLARCAQSCRRDTALREDFTFKRATKSTKFQCLKRDRYRGIEILLEWKKKAL